MTKTSLDVCTEAARMLALVPDDETLQPGMFARAQSHMADIFETLNGNPYNIAFEWTIETVPDGAFLPFARAVAGSIASNYGRDDMTGLYAVGLSGLRAYATRTLNNPDARTMATFF